MKKFIAGALGVAAAAIPGLSFAADYAYVNSTGEVMMVTAATPTEALTTAPGIHINSGVMLLDSSDDREVLE